MSEVHNHGTYPLETLPTGWVNAKVTLDSTRSRWEILNLTTQLRYRQEPLLTIAIKCALLFLIGLPLYFLSYSFMELVRLPLVPIVNCSPSAFIREAWKIIQLPSLFLFMELSALYGIFDPLNGREALAKCEKVLHDGKTILDLEGRDKRSRGALEQIQDLFFTAEPKTAFFIAPCMQPLLRHPLSVEPIPNPVGA